MNGLDEVLGWSDILDGSFPFFGKAVNDNITFIGFNLTYYYSVTRDTTVGRMLEGIVGDSIYSVPDRTFIPLEITYEPDDIVISSPVDGVNTTIAVHDMFEGDFEVLNRLVYVDSGTTKISMHYPYFWMGTSLTAASAIMTGIIAYFIGKKRSPDTDPQ